MFKQITMIVAVVLCVAGIKNANAFIMTYDTLTSVSLGRDIAVAVMAPLAYNSEPTRQFPVLYALHGQSATGSNYDFWNNNQMKTRIMTKPMLVVMFNNKMSMYVDETEFFFNELIPWVEAHYRCLPAAGNRAITGFSSGGYGALHYMLSYPEKFSSAIPMSGAVDYTVQGFNTIQRIKDSLDAGVAVPPIAIFCGTEDGLLAGNDDLASSLGRWGHDYIYTKAAGGHSAEYWTATCPAIVDYAWDHFPALSSMHDETSSVSQNALPQGAILRYNCRGEQMNAHNAHTGIIIEYDGTHMVRKVLLK